MVEVGKLVIAIDGPSASGKSTNARLVARALGFVYVDTGAMYRSLAWWCVRCGVDVGDVRGVGRLCVRWRTELVCVDGVVRFLVDGYFPEREIRTAEVSGLVAQVAAVRRVRDWMRVVQRGCLRFGSLVMEGRDIGSRVFPETDYKFYLDAAPGARLKRRVADGVVEDLAARDERDSRRSAAPLMVSLGAVVIDTSGLSPEESSGLILDVVRSRMVGAGVGVGDGVDGAGGSG